MDKSLRISTHIKLLKQQEFALLEDILLLEASPLFDPDYYLDKYPGIKDANVDPYYHYCLYGWRDGLEPSKDFSCEKYLLQNPEIKGIMSPLIHYLRYKHRDVIASVPAPVCNNVFLEIDRLNKENTASKTGQAAGYTKVQDILSSHFRDLQPIPHFVSQSSDAPKRLILVTDALQKSLLGGVGTALILASKYACKHDMTLFIITRHSPANPESYYSFMQMMHEKVPGRVEFYSDYDRDNKGQKDFRFEVFSNDEFFTTSWWSTRAVKNMNLPNKIFYIVQEVESYFYYYGDQHLFCNQIFQETDPRLMYIVNSHYLWDYFKGKNRNIVENGVFFEPAFPDFLYRRGINTESRRKFFFYCRETHPRNLYYTGLKILDLSIMKGILDPKKWNIYFAGAETSDRIEFSDGTHPQYLGQLSWAQYAEFMSTVDLSLSLMYTPHPSYPPLDTIASGGVCVTNSFANKTSCEWSKNLIFGELTEEGLLKALSDGIKLACDEKTRHRNFEQNSLPHSWDQTLTPVIARMEKFRHG